MTQRWDVGTKRLVGVVVFVLLALILYRFRAVLPPLILAFLLAFILDPVVDFLEQRAHIPRTGATALVFLTIIAVAVTAPVIAVPPIVRAITSLTLDFVRSPRNWTASFPGRFPSCNGRLTCGRSTRSSGREFVRS
jgi:predicted PurR-regulated permease PerM